MAEAAPQEAQQNFAIQRIFVYEVILRLTVTVKNEEETAFLCEVQQGGIFTAEQMEAGQLAHCLGAFCPNILFPYARETISSLVVKGTFPQLNLAPVNFDALFMNYLQQQAQQGEARAHVIYLKKMHKASSLRCNVHFLFLIKVPSS